MVVRYLQATLDHLKMRKIGRLLPLRLTDWGQAATLYANTPTLDWITITIGCNTQFSLEMHSATATPTTAMPVASTSFLPTYCSLLCSVSSRLLLEIDEISYYIQCTDAKRLS